MQTFNWFETEHLMLLSQMFSFWSGLSVSTLLENTML